MYTYIYGCLVAVFFFESMWLTIYIGNSHKLCKCKMQCLTGESISHYHIQLESNNREIDGIPFAETCLVNYSRLVVIHIYYRNTIITVRCL